QRLLSNVERVKRELEVDSSCSIYGHESEDILHILKDCTTAKDVWNQIILVSSDEMMGCNNLSIDDRPFGKQIFLNTDGAVQLDSGNTASVEVILESLKLIQRRGHDKGIIQYDSLE
ncbi:hypothetical protein Goshw_008642, partial [Gossypium schwendimanii]|nr:hypothetical protein [Gossypium schwendimanii]